MITSVSAQYYISIKNCSYLHSFSVTFEEFKEGSKKDPTIVQVSIHFCGIIFEGTKSAYQSFYFSGTIIIRWTSITILVSLSLRCHVASSNILSLVLYFLSYCTIIIISSSYLFDTQSLQINSYFTSDVSHLRLFFWYGIKCLH